MPIEIKELNIKAYIDDSSMPVNRPGTPVTNNTTDTESIIAACVEQVLQILKDKEER
jgi:hypothetical protein